MKNQIALIFVSLISFTAHAQSPAQQRIAQDCGGTVIVRAEAQAFQRGDNWSYELLVGVPEQHRVNVRPELTLPHLRTRVTSINWVQTESDRKPRIVTTSESDRAIHFFKANGRLENSLIGLHGGYDPHLVAANSASGLIVTSGASGEPLVITDSVSGRRAGELSQNGQVFIHDNGLAIWLVTNNGYLEYYSRKTPESTFSLISRRHMYISVDQLDRQLVKRVFAAELSPNKQSLWIASDSGWLLEFDLDNAAWAWNPRYDISSTIEPINTFSVSQKLNISSFAKGSFRIVKGIKFGRTARDMWVALGHYGEDSAATDHSDDFDLTPAHSIDIAKFDPKHVHPTRLFSRVLLNSQLEKFELAGDMLVLVTGKSNDAVTFFDKRAGQKVLSWRLDRDQSGRTHYLSDSSGLFNPLRSSAFSPDKKYFAAGYDGGAVAIWETSTGNMVAVFDSGGSDLRGLSFSPDSKKLGVGAHLGRAVVYDVATAIEKYSR